MNTVAKIIGYVYLVAWLAAIFGLVDMSVCVGMPGSCAAHAQVPKKVLTV